VRAGDRSAGDDGGDSDQDERLLHDPLLLGDAVNVP
jgi:hypothetical protein